MEMDRKNKVIVLFGADRKVGTTMVALSMMEKICANGRRTLLLILHPRAGRTFLPEGGAGIDAIRTQLTSGLLTQEELRQACVQMKTSCVLPGPDDLLSVRHWQPKHVQVLVNLAKSMFDVVLIDAGGGTDVLSGLTVGALEEEADLRFLVTTPQEVPLDQWNRLHPVIERMTDGWQLVVNRDGAAAGLPSPREAAKRYGCPLAGTLPDMGLMGWQAEYDRQTLLTQEAFQSRMTDLLLPAGFEVEAVRRRHWPWQRRKRA